MNGHERNETIKKMIRDHTERVTVSPEAARASLIADGVYTEAGELRPEYGGPSLPATKILFLDIDGVLLCGKDLYASGNHRYLPPEKIELLNEIVQRTGRCGLQYLASRP